MWKRIVPACRSTLHLLSQRANPLNVVCTRALQSNDAGDLSVIGSTEAKLDSSAPLILSQSDVLEPFDFKVKPLDLINVNQSVTPVREVWVENMFTPHSIKLGIVQLHPDIFSAFPRPDVIQENHKWQILYKHVDWRCMRTRAELSGTTKKPWPQKGMGKARQASRRAPQWHKGGWAHGPRGPRTYFYMLPHPQRVAGLIAILSSKFSQNDLYVVDSFEGFPSDGTSAHLEELCEARGWGPSVLFVDNAAIELAPQCTAATHFYTATEQVNHINVLPVYGLNVFSMLKHETLVLTVDALTQLQEKLLLQLKRVDLKNVIFPYKPDGVYRL